MYDELVKRLRAAAIMSEALSIFLPHSEGSSVSKLYNEAADAIEELLQKTQQLPRWIPVTGRMPEKTGVYLAWMKWDLTEPEEEPSAYPIEYDAEEEAFGWWKSYYDAETLGWAGEDFIRYEGITHWMPLPEPPKEGT